MGKKLFILFVLTTFTPCHADMFGGDVMVLTQILSQSILQLAKLKELLGTSSEQLGLLRQVNLGINDSLSLLRTVDPNTDPGLYKDWQNVQDGLWKLQGLYGSVTNSPLAQMERDTDQEVAEAVSFNNNYYRWASQLDEVSEAIKSQSHVVSPGGAEKLTAESMGLLIQVMNQNLRAEASSLKMQAQMLALENAKSKAETRQILDNGMSLRTVMEEEKIDFDIPRF